MKKVFNNVILILLPCLVLGLFVLNGKLASMKYSKVSAKINVYNAEISTSYTIIQGKMNEEELIPVHIKNSGTMTWLTGQINSIFLSYHIMDAKGKIITNDGLRTSLPNTIQPSEFADLMMKLKTPNTIGSYKVEIDMINEGTAWFKDKGSKTIIVDMDVK